MEIISAAAPGSTSLRQAFAFRAKPVTPALDFDLMINSSLRLSASIGAVMLLTACVDHGNKPLLLPVGSPAQLPQIVHILCVGDADAAYGRAKQEFAKRAQMYGPGVVPEQLAEQESQANAAARMKYISCASSQGYRAIYPQGM